MVAYVKPIPPTELNRRARCHETFNDETFTCPVFYVPLYASCRFWVYPTGTTRRSRRTQAIGWILARESRRFQGHRIAHDCPGESGMDVPHRRRAAGGDARRKTMTAFRARLVELVRAGRLTRED